MTDELRELIRGPQLYRWLQEQSQRKQQWSMQEEAAKEAAERLTAKHVNGCPCDMCLELRKAARKMLRKGKRK